jgi:hypothetical protein
MLVLLLKGDYMSPMIIVQTALILLLIWPVTSQAKDCSIKINKIINALNLNIPISNQGIGLKVCDSSGESPYMDHSPYEENNLFTYRSVYSLKTNYPECDQNIHVILEGRAEKFVTDCYGRISLHEDNPTRLPVFMVIINTGKKDMIYEKTVWGWAEIHAGGTLTNRIPTHFKK